MYIHHCMDRIVDWDFKKNDLERCSTCSMENDAGNNCCKDEIKILKIDKDDRHPETAGNQQNFKDVILPIAYFAIHYQFLPVLNKEFPLEDFALNDTVPDLCILNCTYLI